MFAYVLRISSFVRISQGVGLGQGGGSLREIVFSLRGAYAQIGGEGT
jgi:hypothetical protein